MGRVMGRVTGRRFVLALMIGITAGFSFACIILPSKKYATGVTWTNRDHKLHHIVNVIEHVKDEPFHKLNDTDKCVNRSVADALMQKVRVLCWVMTQPKNHELKAKHVKATWGKRCNVLLFMSTEEDASLPTIKLQAEKGRSNLWGKTKAAFRYVYEHHRSDADWFLKADDDTYVVLENLRYLLAEHDSNSPVYLGCRLKFTQHIGIMSGGAGYVLGREALERLVNKGLSSPHLCKTGDDGPEDIHLGTCMYNIGVKIVDTRDFWRRGRFFPFSPHVHLYPGKEASSWLWSTLFYFPPMKGLNCCSDQTVSFHDVSPQHMYMLDHFIYHVRPYGIIDAKEPLPAILRNNFAV